MMKLEFTDRIIAFNNSLRSNNVIKTNPVRQIAWNAMLYALGLLPLVVLGCCFFSLATGIGLPVLPFVILALMAVPALFATVAFSKQIATVSLQMATLLFATPVAFAIDSIIALGNKVSNCFYARVNSKQDGAANIATLAPVKTIDIKRREIKSSQNNKSEYGNVGKKLSTLFSHPKVEASVNFRKINTQLKKCETINAIKNTCS